VEYASDSVAKAIAGLSADEVNVILNKLKKWNDGSYFIVVHDV
jgi:hypothetical protein